MAFMTLRLEALPVTRRDGMISVRMYNDGEPMGLTVMPEEAWAAVALRPPTSELAVVEVAVSEGRVSDLLEEILGQDPKAA